MAGGMLKFLAADLVPNNTDPTKFYTDLYGGCTCAHAIAAIHILRRELCILSGSSLVLDSVSNSARGVSC